MKIKYLSAVLFLAFASSSYAEVRLWVSDDSNDGNFGGREGVDAFCNADEEKPAIADSTTRAFISVNETDEIRDMPTNYNIPTNEVIFGYDGTTQIADNFTALLNASVTPLTNPISLNSFARQVWTGSNSIGAVDTYTCENWTAATGFGGKNGQSDSATGVAIAASTQGCDNGFKTYCITYTPPAPATVRGSASPLKSWE